ncbi:hypothetical protein AMTR_s00025p00145840 [Amborella trichopoda]|uniref:CW-type domain-containing protein n=2 Tax=Amborella trichopoda TaxID=13333 RepID=W1PQY0_AMBTC|nr:hypothetical protein AMTR_s00025p00145840 [Amborella trichopoda]
MEKESSLMKKKPKKFNYTPGAYAVQCYKCMKWRSVGSKHEFETIRASFIEDPWYCNKNPNVSCDDPADLEYDASRIWIIDKPNLPKPPQGFERELVLRRCYSKIDAHYTTPTGKKVRAPSEIGKFLDSKSEYKEAGVDVSQFCFTVPKIMNDMFLRKRESGDDKSRNVKSKVEDD